MLKQCCQCRRVEAVTGWVLPPNPARVQRVASHTYCPACRAAVFPATRDRTRDHHESAGSARAAIALHVSL